MTRYPENKRQLPVSRRPDSFMGPKIISYAPGLPDLDLQANEPAEVRGLGDLECYLKLRLLHNCCLLPVLLSPGGP